MSICVVIIMLCKKHNQEIQLSITSSSTFSIRLSYIIFSSFFFFALTQHINQTDICCIDMIEKNLMTILTGLFMISTYVLTLFDSLVVTNKFVYSIL